MESVLKKKSEDMVGRICRNCFKPRMKRVTAVMDDESGELMEMMKKVPLKRLGE